MRSDIPPCMLAMAVQIKELRRVLRLNGNRKNLQTGESSPGSNKLSNFEEVEDNCQPNKMFQVEKDQIKRRSRCS